jgi:hypothetical protein
MIQCHGIDVQLHASWYDSRLFETMKIYTFLYIVSFFDNRIRDSKLTSNRMENTSDCTDREKRIISDKDRKFQKCLYYCKKLNEVNDVFEFDKNKLNSIDRQLWKEMNCYWKCYHLFK